MTLLALLKHPLVRGCDAPRAIATLERAILRGPRPKPGTAGLAHALQTFRDELEKLRPRGAIVAASLRSAHAITDAELDAAAGLVGAAQGARWRRWKRLPRSARSRSRAHRRAARRRRSSRASAA